ncbi:MAG: hypothetical protein Q8932_19765, partial [Bacteroidota bacterium]|nr:hypothetical protein [Bacteroidota bacterium]
MNRQQVLVAGAGVVLLLALTIFGKTVPPSKKAATALHDAGSPPASGPKSIDLEDILQAAQTRLSPSQLSYVSRLENSVVRGDVRQPLVFADGQFSEIYASGIFE